MKFSILLIASFVASLEALVDNYGFGWNSWNYNTNSNRGPQRWYVREAECAYKSQSPINILTGHVRVDEKMSFRLHHYNQKGDGMDYTIKNRNKDVAFIGNPKSDKKDIQYVEFNDTNFRFFEFSFHWGDENTRGSEHLIDSQRYAGEVHFKHYNTKYNSADVAMSKPDGMLIWSFFLRVNSQNHTNKEMQELLKHFGSVKYSTNSTNLELNLINLLPKTHHKFFTYHGSLTAPPCYQSVRWIINREPIFISEDQMKIFRSLWDSKSGAWMGDNYRPIQKLNDRIVHANFKIAHAQNSAGITASAPTFLTMISILSVLFFTNSS